uniref:Dolichyl-phosphate-mannose--protein mannosyltransferase n=1 Tax=Heterorhabditis bacteriophora TaxID=37862 RepID=A0A1I7XPE3_HETBA
MLLISNELPIFWIYGLHAGLTLVLAGMFGILYRDRPQYHPWVNGVELNKIVAGKVQLPRSFLVDYLGGYSALPFVLMPVSFAISGLLNRFSCCPSTTHVRVWNTVGFAVTAIFIIILPILFHLDAAGLAVYFLPLSLAPLGLIVCGILQSLTLVGRLYAQHIISYMGASMAFAYSILPFIVTYLVINNEYLISVRRSSGWAESSWDPLVNTKMRNLEPIDMSQDECGLYEMRLIGPSRKQ